MKKIFILLFCFVLCGCGVKQEEYDQKVLELEKINAEYENYKTEKESEISNLIKAQEEEVNGLKDEINVYISENDELKSKTSSLDAETIYLNERITDINKKNEELREEILSYQNVNLDTINLFFEDDKIVADEIVIGEEKWLLLTDIKYDLYDLILGEVEYDSDTFAMKLLALSKEEWFDYSNIFYNITISGFGIIGSFEIEPTTFEIRQATWEKSE